MLMIKKFILMIS